MPKQPVIPNKFSCSSVISGLSSTDCNCLAQIGLAGQGSNPTAPNGQFWIGGGGPSKFDFTNNAGKGVTLVMWYDGASPQTSTGPYVSATAPLVSYSLAAGATVTVSLAGGVSGGWAGGYSRSTVLSTYGQVSNTWREFTTGSYATVDVSRLVNMNGNGMSVTTSSGCSSNMNTCVYQCKRGKSSEGLA